MTAKTLAREQPVSVVAYLRERAEDHDLLHIVRAIEFGAVSVPIATADNRAAEFFERFAQAIVGLLHRAPWLFAPLVMDWLLLFAPLGAEYSRDEHSNAFH